MSTVRVNLGRGAGVLLGALLATAGNGQERPAVPSGTGGVHRMQIFQGPTLTVRYFSAGLSPGDATTLNELERAENEVNYVRNLQALKGRYVADERRMEKNRSFIQEQLYGRSTSASSMSSFSFGWGGPGRFGTGLGYPLSYNWGGYGGGMFGPALGGGSQSETDNLAYGTGYEGPIKEAMAPVLAAQATPDYAAATIRNYNVALGHVAASPVLAAGVRMPDGSKIQPAAGPSGPTTITLKDGKTITGDVVGEDNDFIVVDTKTQRIRVRKSEVVREEQNRTQPRK